MNIAEHAPIDLYGMSGRDRDHNYSLVDSLPLSYREQILEPFANTVRVINPQATILDLGSGPGGVADYFDCQGFKTVRADISNEAMRAAQGDKVIAEACGLPFGNAAFDAVHIKDTISHIKRKDLFLKGLSRVLKQGGLLLITDKSCWGFGPSKLPYYYFFKKELLILIAQHFRFRVQSEETWRPYWDEKDWYETNPKRFVLTFRKE